MNHTETNMILNFTTSNSRSSHNSDAYIASIVFIVIAILLIVFGSIGNIISFIVLRTGELKKLSTCFYMSALAVADTGVLWTIMFVTWVKFLTQNRIHLGTWLDCKLFFFTQFSFSYISSAILAIMCVEKWFALYFPLKAKSLCTVKVAKRVTLVTYVIFAAYDFHWFFNAQAIVNKKGYPLCAAKNVDPKIIATIDGWLYTYIPCLVMVVFNSAIIAKLCRKRKTEMGTTGKSSSKIAKQGTLMLLAITFVFIVLSTPTSIYWGLSETAYSNTVMFTLSTLLQAVNHSINALLYTLSGSKYRQGVKRVFNACKKSNRAVGNYAETSGTRSQEVNSVGTGHSGSTLPLAAEASTQVTRY